MDAATILVLLLVIAMFALVVQTFRYGIVNHRLKSMQDELDTLRRSKLLDERELRRLREEW